MSVLLGHTAPVTFIDFCACIPDALLSSSLDGTCRIWSAKDGGAAVHVLTATPSFGPTRGLTRFGGGAPPGELGGRHTRSAVAPPTAPPAAAGGASTGRAGAGVLAGPGPSSLRLAAAAASAAAAGPAPALGDEAQPGMAGQNVRPSLHQSMPFATGHGQRQGLAWLGMPVVAVSLLSIGSQQNHAGLEVTKSQEPCCGRLQETPGLLVCSFSNDASYIVAGSNDCCTYVWHWDQGHKGRHKHSNGFNAPAEETDNPPEEDLLTCVTFMSYSTPLLLPFKLHAQGH